MVGFRVSLGEIERQGHASELWRHRRHRLATQLDGVLRKKSVRAYKLCLPLFHLFVLLYDEPVQVDHLSRTRKVLPPEYLS
jgi:hypothetical protein